MSIFSTTLSSKNQITLPVQALRELGWQSGQKFSIIVQNNTITIQTADDILDDIKNIVSKYDLPKVSTEEAIRQTHERNQDHKYQYDSLS